MRGIVCIAVMILGAIELSGCAIVVGVMVVDGVQYYSTGPDGMSSMYRAPEPDPARAINAQDCTQPVDFGAGNLRCR